eukprot:425198_1
MKSYCIGIFNMNELIEQNDYKYPIALNINHKVKTNRIKPFSKYQSLMDAYSKRYNISLKNMFILQSHDERTVKFSVQDKFKILHNIKKVIHEKVEKNKRFYILDKNKIVCLNNSDIVQTMTDAIQSHKLILETYSIVLLQYFDRHAQRIQNIQFLWLDPMTKPSRLETYILND